MKTSFIYSGRKGFCRKMDVHIIGRESISSFYMKVNFTCIISCISDHLTEPLPFGDVVEDSLPIDKLDIKTFFSMKGMTSQEAEGWLSPIGDFRHFRYKFFPFLTFLTGIRLLHFV